MLAKGNDALYYGCQIYMDDNKSVIYVSKE